MSVPKSVTRIKRDGIEYISSVDRCNYTIFELTRGALRDVGKFLVVSMNKTAQKLPGMKKNPRVRGKNSTFQKWVRKRECDLQIGTKQETWYGYRQEFGTSGMKQLGIIKSTTMDNIPTIIEIESKYLSALEDEARALSLVDENDEDGGFADE